MSESNVEHSSSDQTTRAINFVATLLKHMEVDAEAQLAPEDGESTEDEIRIERSEERRVGKEC